MGLYRAGFDVIGVDIKPQPKYPFTFVQADALSPPFDLQSFSFIWASPPCQAHTALKNMWNSRTHVDLIPQTRALLAASGCPYVMENVVGAPLRSTIRLCGTMFDLRTPCGAELRRHRDFECSFLMLQPECRHGARDADVIGVTGHGPHNWKNDSRVVSVFGGKARDRRRGAITVCGESANMVRKTFSVDDARIAMGIDWMAMKELSQAIPPAYSEFIGRAAIKQIQCLAA